jgi:hypothetical protein
MAPGIYWLAVHTFPLQLRATPHSNNRGDGSIELNKSLEFNSQSIPGKTMKSRVKN